MYFIEPIFAWNFPLASLIFLKRSLVISIPSVSSISLHWSLHWSLKAFLSLSSYYSLELCIQIGTSFAISFAFSVSSLLNY